MNRTELFNKMYELTGDPWTETEEEKRETERQFYRDLESGDVSLYLDILTTDKKEMCITETKDGTEYDFQLMNQYDSVIDEIRKYESPDCPTTEEIEHETEGSSMRKWTVINSNYGGMPSAGFAQEFIKMVSCVDGWYAIEFLKMLSEWSQILEDGGIDDDFYFYIDCEPETCFELDFGFCWKESEMITIQDRNKGINRRWFRWFLLNEDTGVEELQFLI